MPAAAVGVIWSKRATQQFHEVLGSEERDDATHARLDADGEADADDDVQGRQLQHFESFESRYVRIVGDVRTLTSKSGRVPEDGTRRRTAPSVGRQLRRRQLTVFGRMRSV